MSFFSGGALFFVLLLTPLEAWSYIDPGAGSNVLQKILAPLMAILAMVGRLFSRNRSDDDE